MLTLVVFVILSAGLAMGIALCFLLVSLLSPTACGLDRQGARCTRTRPTLLQSLRGGSPSLRTIRLEGAPRVLAGMHYRALSPVDAAEAVTGAPEAVLFVCSVQLCTRTWLRTSI